MTQERSHDLKVLSAAHDVDNEDTIRKQIARLISLLGFLVRA